MAEAGAVRSARGAGRPAIGRRVLVTLSDAQIATARMLGSGVIAAGVRAALELAAQARRSRRTPPAV